jgi:hypothetical protein
MARQTYHRFIISPVQGRMIHNWDLQHITSSCATAPEGFRLDKDGALGRLQLDLFDEVTQAEKTLYKLKTQLKYVTSAFEQAKLDSKKD